RVTINTVLQGAWSFLLSKYTNAKQVAFGTTVSGRVSALEQIESRIGLFINTIPISIGIEEDSSIGDWLAQIQQQHTASREYQHTPLADIQSIAGLTTELFDSILVFENYPVEEAAKASTSLQIERIEAEEQNNYALTLTVVAEEELLIRFSYNNAVLDERYVKTMMAQLRQVLSEISLGAQREVQTINWIPAAEKNLLLDEFNDTAARYPEGETVLEVFEQQVQKRGGQTAISFEGAELTYVELNQKSDQLAAYLRQQGVESSSIVPICMNRSLEMIIGILGVLKTGASFVPIDPEMPQDRTDYILEDIGSPLLISMQNQRRATSASSRVTRIELDADWPLIDAVEGENIRSHFPAASDLAYTIYTSGTTGRPKGVMIEHKALHNFICSMTDNLGADENLRFLSVTTFSFDIAYLEFFLPLTSGGCLIMAGDQLAADPARLIPYIDGNAPTHMQATPSRWQMLLDAGWRNEAQVNVLTGGEAISESLKDRLVALGQDKTWNMYGPTETTIWSSMCELNPQQAVRIGQPIANTQIYILTEDLAVQPIGLWGELYIGGDGLARGYFKRPDLTSERFVEHTFADGSTRRLYRTGDVARWLPDGQIEYSGRVDYQVKIRGYRIELAEIETILEEVEGIGRAVASVGQDKRGNKHLIAYVVADGAFDAVRTKKYLKQKLPSYMLPNCFVELEDLPLTPNGKVDRKALPQPDGNELGRKEYIAPANELEASIAGIWEKFLGLESIGVEDDFFDLGGHSLLANRIVVAIQAELGISTPIRTLFQHPTIRDFAASISTGQHDKEVSIPKVLDKPERIPLSYGQERLWFVDKFEGSTHYHMPLILDLDGPVDVAILEQSVQYLVNRYQALRTIFKEEDAVPYQCVLPENNWQLGPIIDASEWDKEKTQQHIQALINQPFDLQKDHMIRAAVVHTDKKYDTLVMVIHHIAFDGWSLLIFAEELTKVYRALAAEQQPELAELPVDYTDYSIWQRDYLSGDRLKEHLAYWSEKLEDVEPLNLPTDFIRPAHKTTAGSSVDIALGKDLSDQLERLARQEDATLFMVLLSVLKVLLHRYSGQTDICIGTPIANREQVEVEQLIGYFINTLALRSDLSGQPSFRELLRLVRDNTLEAYEYQQTPFEKVIDDNITHRDLSRTPLFQVMLVLQNFAAVSELYFGETQAQAVDFDMGISKYDLNFIVLPSADGLEISIEYSSDLFERSTIERMAQHFKVLLTEAAKNPFCRIDQLPMLTQAESQQILFDFNDTDHPYAVDKTMVEIFEEQVERTPDQIAIISNGKSYSYDWLNKASNRLAHYLREQGVGRETSVVVVMDRDVRLIAALFGILKAGGKYIPIEPYLPENRKLTVMNTVETKIFVTNNTDYLSPAAHREQVASIYKMICLQEDADLFIGIDEHEQDQIEAVDVETYPVTNPKRINEVSDLAYVIFTSGSTGTPKGVAVQHKPAINLIEWVNNTYGVGESDKILMVSSVSFDLSVYDIFGGLSAGATLRIANRTELDDPEILANIIIEEGITFWDSAPAMLQQVIPFLEIRQADTKAKGKLRLSFSSGDWIPLQMPVQMRNLFSDDYRFIALGGATEATIWSNFFEPTEIDKNWRSIP
ncbi:MAG: amino acid adenylation domain-containing protein, partial [Bacteroidota bacterium]